MCSNVHGKESSFESRADKKAMSFKNVPYKIQHKGSLVTWSQMLRNELKLPILSNVSFVRQLSLKSVVMLCVFVCSHLERAPAEREPGSSLLDIKETQAGPVSAVPGV